MTVISIEDYLRPKLFRVDICEGTTSLGDDAEVVWWVETVAVDGTQTEIYFGGSYDDALAAAVAKKLSINDATAEGYYRSTGGAA